MSFVLDATKDLRELIGVVKDVRPWPYIHYPRIVVFGCPCCATSSVIESLLGIRLLPRVGKYMRRPLELPLVPNIVIDVKRLTPEIRHIGKRVKKRRAPQIRNIG